MVELPVPMRQHMLGNMRDHLQAISAIEDALATGAFDRAGQIAEQRLGLSSLAAHGAEHMAPYMPKEMQGLGTGMHRAASRFALVVQETSADGDLKKAIGSLAAVMFSGVGCAACTANPTLGEMVRLSGDTSSRRGENSRDQEFTTRVFHVTWRDD